MVSRMDQWSIYPIISKSQLHIVVMKIQVTDTCYDMA